MMFFHFQDVSASAHLFQQFPVLQEEDEAPEEVEEVVEPRPSFFESFKDMRRYVKAIEKPWSAAKKLRLGWLEYAWSL